MLDGRCRCTADQYMPTCRRRSSNCRACLLFGVLELALHETGALRLVRELRKEELQELTRQRAPSTHRRREASSLRCIAILNASSRASVSNESRPARQMWNQMLAHDASVASSVDILPRRSMPSTSLAHDEVRWTMVVRPCTRWPSTWNGPGGRSAAALRHLLVVHRAHHDEHWSPACCTCRSPPHSSAARGRACARHSAVGSPCRRPQRVAAWPRCVSQS